MKSNLKILPFLLLPFCVTAQRADTTWLTATEVSLLSQIEKETEQIRMVELTEELLTLSDAKSTVPLLEEAKKMYGIAKRKKSLYLESVALTMFGQASRLAGDFVKALQYHIQAMEISRNLPDKTLYAYSVNQSAHMYKDREENGKAIAIYREAFRIAGSGNSELFKFYPAMNLGFMYLNTNQPDSSLYFSNRAINLLNELLVRTNNEDRRELEKSTMTYTLSNLAGAYSQKKENKKADSLYSEARKRMIKYKGEKSRYFYFFFMNLTQHFQRNNQVDSSLYAARMAIETVMDAPLEYLSAKPAKILSDYYEKRNADSTVKYLKIFLKANEVLNSTQVTQQMQTMAFEEDLRKMEIQQAEKAYRDKLIFYLLTGGVLALLIVALYMYRANVTKRKMNEELAKQKNQVETTLSNLKSTQAQLIQSEKMASLGELTAGIAHEIQNPLNFVNNFSEVSSELIDEMKTELATGNVQLATEISNDLKQNLEKINHHGKRAASIVSGMLQHSRASSGTKEPTDINALADEYLRLAYHGLRAKDKSFNAKFETDFDSSLPKMNVVPQDIGRVILNLITNAFYVVNEKSKQGIAGYEPTVTVSTKLESGTAGITGITKIIKIRVKDNGNGIPQKILDKIFQPFFTTKPTGQGTGLGLSLSYDIVKAHGGELKVDTKEGEGSTFTIQLPVS